MYKKLLFAFLPYTNGWTNTSFVDKAKSTIGSVMMHVGIVNFPGVQWTRKSSKSRFDLWISPGKLDKHQ